MRRSGQVIAWAVLLGTSLAFGRLPASTIEVDTEYVDRLEMAVHGLDNAEGDEDVIRNALDEIAGVLDQMSTFASDGTNGFFSEEHDVVKELEDGWEPDEIQELVASLRSGINAARADITSRVRARDIGYVDRLEEVVDQLEDADSDEGISVALDEIGGVLDQVSTSASEGTSHFFTEVHGVAKELEDGWTPEELEQLIQSLRTEIAAARTHLGVRFFLRGDGNGDGEVDISDAVQVLHYLFVGGDAPSCLKAADANDDGKVDISDPVALLGYLFNGTPRELPGPSRACGL